MNIRTAAEFGHLIRQARRAQKLRQIDLAAFTGCGERFIIDLEKGKPTCELEKALHVANMLGIHIDCKSPEERLELASKRGAG